MFEAFSQKDLQNIKAVLLHGMRQSADLTVHELLLAVENELVEVVPLGTTAGLAAQKQTIDKTCPSCGGGHMVGPYRIGNMSIMRCSRKCGYSEDI